ncbi:MAG: primosomal protein N' [Pseudomonadota bacterium]
MTGTNTTAGFVGEFAVPIPVYRRFFYWVPSHFASRAVTGARVVLAVGKRKLVGFYLGRAADQSGKFGKREIKPIDSFIDARPVFSEKMVSFLLRAADYYHYPEGQVFKSAFGPQTALSKRRITATAKGRTLLEDGKLAELEQRVVDLAARSPKTEKQLKRYVPLLTQDKLGEMLRAGIIMESEVPDVSTRDDERICLYLGGRDPVAEGGAITERQKSILDALKVTEGVTVGALRRSLPVSGKDIQTLRREGFLKIEELPAGHLLEPPAGPGGGDGREIRLNEKQKAACGALDSALVKGKFETFLLFGVTGSGKTEVYLRAILRALKLGRSAVVIVPEIALTPQLLDSFRRKMGEQVAVIHSGLGAAARKMEMKDIKEGRKKVVVGARSALFSLVSNPGVFVVDEEHDGSLKQEEGFRYSARDMAILRAKGENAVAILSSATPMIESFHNASGGKYKLLTLPDRVTLNPVPDVHVINMRKHLYGPLNQPYISAPLYKAIQEALSSGGQAMIFLNRRGYAPINMCRDCGDSIRCPDCSITLTYHRFTERLSCHQCGYSRGATTRCPQCGSAEGIEIKGPGTERIEEVVRSLFPSARVLRMDSDIASGMACEPILRKLRDGKADILVGTQMITKGHDLPRVALVGVIRADAELNFPDFRAAEKTFSVLTQVAGRAGRGELPGRVFLQTFNPLHPAIEAACRQNYVLFYQWEIKNRKKLFYPPFSYLALVRLEGADEGKVADRARDIVGVLRNAASGARGTVQILGPAPSPILKIRKRFRYQILLKAAKRKTVGAIMDELISARLKNEKKSDVRVIIDIDPLGFM